MVGFFLNCSEHDFAADIFNHDKLFETRNADMLKALANKKDVVLIKTGCGEPELMGRVNFGDRVFIPDYNEAHFAVMLERACIPKNTTFYTGRGTKNGMTGKYFYEIKFAKEFGRHFKLSDCKNVIRHGRSWCEFEL